MDCIYIAPLSKALYNVCLSFTHQQQLAAMQGTNQLVRSNQGNFDTIRAGLNRQTSDFQITALTRQCCPKCLKACNFRMGKKCDLSDFDHGMIVGARRGGLSISENANLMGFSGTTVSRVCRECCKKHLGSSCSAGRNVLLIREVREEGPDSLKLTGR